MGQHLASFLIDAGWYLEAAEVLETEVNNHDNLNMMAKLLQARSEFRQFDKAEQLFQEINKVEGGENAYVYCEVSNYFFWRSMYKESFQWSLKAVKGITTKTPARVIVDILRQAGKKRTLGQESAFYPKIHILKIPIFDKIHIFKVSFFTKFTIPKSNFS